MERHPIPFEEEFDARREQYWPGEPTQEIDLNEIHAHMWGNTYEDMRTGPDFYDRQGMPVDIEWEREHGDTELFKS